MSKFITWLLRTVAVPFCHSVIHINLCADIRICLLFKAWCRFKYQRLCCILNKSCRIDHILLTHNTEGIHKSRNEEVSNCQVDYEDVAHSPEVLKYKAHTCMYDVPSIQRVYVLITSCSRSYRHNKKYICCYTAKSNNEQWAKLS